MARARSRRKAGDERQSRSFYCAVAGVTFEGRQRIIKRHCREGDAIELIAEPDNPHSETAVGVWVRRRGWLFKGWVQVGYIPGDESESVSRLLERGWIPEGSIDHVVGGGWFRRWGLRIQVELRPGPPPDSRG